MFSFSTINDFHAALQQKTTTCTIAVQHYLNNIALNKKLNAFVNVYEQEAIEKAKFLEIGRAHV